METLSVNNIQRLLLGAGLAGDWTTARASEGSSGRTFVARQEDRALFVKLDECHPASSLRGWSCRKLHRRPHGLDPVLDARCLQFLEIGGDGGGSARSPANPRHCHFPYVWSRLQTRPRPFQG